MVVQVWLMATTWRSGRLRAARRTLRPGWPGQYWLLMAGEADRVTYAAKAVDAYLADGCLWRGVRVWEVIDGGCHCS
jgi:hypothetical protein